MKEGLLVPVGLSRTRAGGMEKLYSFVQNAKNIRELAVVYNTTPDEAQSLIDRISSFFAKEKIRLARLGPGLGVHGGPGILFVSIMSET